MLPPYNPTKRGYVRRELLIDISMNKIYSLAIGLLSCAVLGLAACSETEVEDVEYANWQARNATYFTAKLQQANDSVALARQRYGNTWEQQSNWRSYRTYKLASAPVATQQDSVAVEVVKRGAGTTKTAYSDSVEVRYRGVLIPTNSQPQGLVFSHSGLYEEADRTFDPQYAGTSHFRVSSFVEGVSTAVMHMVEGDRCRIYLPAKLGYADKKAGLIPAHSTLIFDVEIVKLYNAERANAERN